MKDKDIYRACLAILNDTYDDSDFPFTANELKRNIGLYTYDDEHITKAMLKTFANAWVKYYNNKKNW